MMRNHHLLPLRFSVAPTIESNASGGGEPNHEASTRKKGPEKEVATLFCTWNAPFQ